jgi:hypothetical protein
MTYYNPYAGQILDPNDFDPSFRKMVQESNLSNKKIIDDQRTQSVYRTIESSSQLASSSETCMIHAYFCPSGTTFQSIVK